VYRFAWRMTNSASAAEDILQDVFLTALQDRNRFEERRGDLRPFLLGIARNLVLKRFRTESRWVPWDEDLACSYVHLDNVDETGAVVTAAIQDLPPAQREVLILATYEELPIAEIAQLIAVEIPVVKARLYRARENLRRMLAPLKSNLSGSSSGTFKR